MTLTLLIGLHLTAHSAEPVSGSRVGNRLTDFALLDASTVSRTMPGFVKGKKTLLYVYSGCCGHCSEQLVQLTALVKRLEKMNVTFVGVEYLGTTDSCSTQIKKHDLPGTLLADSKGTVCGQLGVGDFTVFTLDAAGVIRYRGDINKFQAIELSLAEPRLISTGIHIGDRIENFRLMDLKEKSVGLHEVLLKRQTLLYFYSGCCDHCGTQLRRFAGTARTIEKKGVNVVGVAYLGKNNTCRGGPPKEFYVGRQFGDMKYKVNEALGVRDFTVFHIDENNVIRYRGEVEDLPALEKSFGL